MIPSGNEFEQGWGGYVEIILFVCPVSGLPVGTLFMRLTGFADFFDGRHWSSGMVFRPFSCGRRSLDLCLHRLYFFIFLLLFFFF